MADSSIGNTPGNSVAELSQDLSPDLASASKKSSWPNQYPPPGPVPIPDSAASRISDLATNDLANLSNFLNPASPVRSVKMLSEATEVSVPSTPEETSMSALRRFWFRSPLLAISIGYAAIGLVGAGVFAVAGQVLSAPVFTAVGQVAFATWVFGFLAMAAFGFHSFARFTPPARN